MALPEFEMRRGEGGSEEAKFTYDVCNGVAKKQTIALIGCVISTRTRGRGCKFRKFCGFRM